MAEEKKREVAPVVPNRVQMAEHGRNVWLVTAESSEHPQDFLKPEFYAHVAKDMRPFDHVEVRTDDGLYWALLLVLTADKTWAKVEPLIEKRLQPVNHEQAVDTGYVVEFKGPNRKWSVIRKMDKSAVSEGHADRPSAEAWLGQHLRTIGRKAA